MKSYGDFSFDTGYEDLKGINLHSTLSELGLNSLTSVEIKDTLEHEFGICLNVQDIRNLTFAKVEEIAKAKSSHVKSDDVAEEKTQL